jgi:Outer membrane lipoprotein-sorting protein
MSRRESPRSMKPASVIAFTAVIVIRGVAYAETLTTLLQGVTEADRLAKPLRAEASADIDAVAGKSQDRVVIIERSGAEASAPRQIFVQFEKPAVRLLALGPSEVYLATGGKAKKASAESAVAGTSFTAEDFLPFSPERCAAMRTADLGQDSFTVVCEPKKPPSQYSLIVYKFDREKSVLVQALLYKDSMTNLVKLLRHDDFVRVGGSWRPKRIVMQDYKLRTKDVLTLDWKEDTAAPAQAFDAKSFGAAQVSATR